MCGVVRRGLADCTLAQPKGQGGAPPFSYCCRRPSSSCGMMDKFDPTTATQRTLRSGPFERPPRVPIDRIDAPYDRHGGRIDPTLASAACLGHHCPAPAVALGVGRRAFNCSWVGCLIVSCLTHRRRRLSFGRLWPYYRQTSRVRVLALCAGRWLGQRLAFSKRLNRLRPARSGLII